VGAGLLTITGTVDNGGNNYDINVTASAGVAIGDHLCAELPSGEDAVYRVVSIPGSSTINVQDDLLEAHGTPFGQPAAGAGAFQTPGTALGLTFMPETTRGWRAAHERNWAILDSHSAEHATGGDDPFLGQILNARAIADRIRETGGPTVLTVGAIQDNYLLARQGTTVVGLASSAITKFAGNFESATITTGDIPDGCWGWWWDTTASQLKIVRNRSGVLYGVEANPL
jgi:hypothetical protein